MEYNWIGRPKYRFWHVEPKGKGLGIVKGSDEGYNWQWGFRNLIMYEGRERTLREAKARVEETFDLIDEEV